MKHEAFREQLALSLYGELDPAESAELARHIDACADCRRFASELRAGLGQVVAERRIATEHELPRAWRERLDLAWKQGERRRLSPWWAAAAGFAAGLLIAWALVERVPAKSPAPLVQRGAPIGASAGSSAGAAADATAYVRFKRAAAPPLASTSGQLARMTRYLKR